MDNVSLIAKFLVYSKSITAWRDGSSFAYTWNWWHPFSWIGAPIMLILACFLNGVFYIKENPEDLGLKLSAYWKMNKENREFL